jgi:hypothetical protein
MFWLFLKFSQIWEFWLIGPSPGIHNIVLPKVDDSSTLGPTLWLWILNTDYLTLMQQSKFWVKFFYFTFSHEGSVFLELPCNLISYLFWGTSPSRKLGKLSQIWCPKIIWAGDKSVGDLGMFPNIWSSAITLDLSRIPSLRKLALIIFISFTLQKYHLIGACKVTMTHAWCPTPCRSPQTCHYLKTVAHHC